MAQRVNFPQIENLDTEKEKIYKKFYEYDNKNKGYKEKVRNFLKWKRLSERNIEELEIKKWLF